MEHLTHFNSAARTVAAQQTVAPLIADGLEPMKGSTTRVASFINGNLWCVWIQDLKFISQAFMKFTTGESILILSHSNDDSKHVDSPCFECPLGACCGLNCNESIDCRLNA